MSNPCGRSKALTGMVPTSGYKRLLTKKGVPKGTVRRRDRKLLTSQAARTARGGWHPGVVPTRNTWLAGRLTAILMTCHGMSLSGTVATLDF